MGKSKQAIQNWKGGELPDDCLTFVSYISIFSMFLLSFYYVYHKSAWLLGILLLYLVNIVWSVFFAKDIFASEKANIAPLISFALIAILAMNVVSSTMVMMTLRNLHASFLKKESSIELSDKSQKMLKEYLKLWIATIIMTWVLFAFYFVEPASQPFLNYMFIGQTLSPLFMFGGFLIKIVFALTSVGFSAYMVFVGKTFSDIKTKQLDM